jgi:quercetin dioxygenase-like cupin family protein
MNQQRQREPPPAAGVVRYPASGVSAGVGRPGAPARCSGGHLILRALLGLLLLAGCAPRTPRVGVGALTAEGLDAFLAKHRLGPGQTIRVDLLDRTQNASYHLVQAHGAELPHRHASHDLSVMVLRGRGTLTLAGVPTPLGAGDMIFVRRGTPHWFASDGSGTAVALVIFTPPLDAPDSVPVDSPRGGG